MPLAYVCPECDLRFRPRPDEPPGSVRCPECWAPVTARRIDPPRRRTSSGMPTWAVVVLIILGVKVVVAVGIGAIAVLIAAADSTAKWETFDWPDAQVKIDMPGHPVKTKADIKDGDDDNLQMFAVERRRGREAFMIGWVEDIDTDSPPKDVLDRMVQGYLGAQPGNRQVSRRAIWNGPYPGDEFVMSTREGTMVIHTHLVGDRAYILIAGGRGFNAQTPDVVRFFDSFRVTDAPDFRTPATDAPPVPADR